VVDETLEPRAGDADATDDGAEAESFQEQSPDEVAFFLGDGSFAWVGDEAVSAAATAERRGSGGVEAVADDMSGGTARAGRDRGRFSSCSVHTISISCRAKSHYLFPFASYFTEYQQ